MTFDPRCRKCKAPLITSDEVDDGHCEECIEQMIARSERARDWAHWHPGEPAPECELEP